MKKLTFWKSLFLLFALIVGTSTSWAEEGDVKVTISYSDIPANNYNADGLSGSISKTVSVTNDLTVSYAGINRKASGGATYSYAMFLQNKGYVYSSSAPSGYYPSKVTVTFSSTTGTSGKAGITYGTSALTTRNSSVTGSVTQSGTCELTNSDQTKQYWNFSTTSKNVQVDKIEVVYSLITSSNTPSIAADDVPIAYNATNGSIAYTINNGVDGGAITSTEVTASNPSSWLTVSNTLTSPIALTCSANNTASERTATVTLTYTYNTTETVTKEVTVTQAANPNVFNNISDITASGTSYKIKGTVVATNARGFVTGDGTGYIYYYKGNDAGKSVGDILSIDGTTGTYGQVLQFTGTPTITTEEASNYDGNPAVSVVTTLPDYSDGLHLSTYVQFEGTLAKNSSNYEITVGSKIARISYPTTAQTTALEALLNKTVRVKGYFAGNASSTFTVMLESVEEVVNPTIVANPASLTDFTYELGNGPSAAQSITVSGSNLTANITLSLGVSSNYEMSLSENSGYTNSLSLTPTTGTVAETTVYVRLKEGLAVNASYEGTITLTSTDATDKSVSLAGSVTAPEGPNFTWELNKKTYDDVTDTDIVTWSSDYATMTNSSESGGTSASNYLGGDSNNRTSSRFYSSNTLTITPASGYAIDRIIFTAASNGYASALANSTWTNATATGPATNTETTATVTPTNGALPISAAVGATCGFTAVKVYYAAATSVTLTPAKTYTTLTSSHNLDFTSVSDDLKAYIATEIADSKVKMTQVNKVPAGTGLVLKATTPNTAVDVPVFDGTGADEVSGNKMAGSATTITAVAANGGYILSDGIFQPASKGNLAAGKAYLDIEVASARALEMTFEGETTGINGVEEVAPVTKTRKVVKNGRLVIETANGEFTIDGARMK